MGVGPALRPVRSRDASNFRSSRRLCHVRTALAASAEAVIGPKPGMLTAPGPVWALGETRIEGARSAARID